MSRTLRCDGVSGCAEPVTYIDNKGWIYCARHGIARKAARPCRKMTRAEIATLTDGRTISYTPKPKATMDVQPGSWTEYDAAAEWTAERGLTGKAGDPLPMGLSAVVLAEINEHNDEFMERVDAMKYAQAMEKIDGGRDLGDYAQERFERSLETGR